MRLALALLMILSLPLAAESEWDKQQIALKAPVEITVNRSPNCQCCHKWIEHLQTHGFSVIDQITHNLEAVPARGKVPNELRSCHTAVVEGYLVEGHVPADDIKQLLLQKPDILGLTVPQMPVGTPGMEMGPRKDNFTVISFDNAGQYRIFNRYEVGTDGDYHSIASPD
jgi:hypothetical protein